MTREIKQIINEATDRLAEAIKMKPRSDVELKIVEAQEQLLDLLTSL